MSTTPPPYPADTRAKGWRFELDLEQVRQSDTWALANAATRPWLLMLWATAWEQVPCGSLPNEDALIAARMGMDLKAFTKVRAVLLRGWWLADDGRLYQGTIVTRVLSMLDKRMKDAERAAKNRAKRESSRVGDAVITPLSRVTNTGLGSEFDTKHQAPSTKHQKENTHPEYSEGVVRVGLSAGEVCKAMKANGVGDPNPGHQDLLMLIQAGATLDEFSGAAAEAARKRKGFAYAVGIVKARRIEAAQAAQLVHQGAMPASSPTRSELASLTAGFMTGSLPLDTPFETPSMQPETIDVDSRLVAP